MTNKKLIVITGASAGIGAATARLFSKMGHPLLLLARRLDKLEALDLPHSIFRKVDVVDMQALKSTIQEAEQAFGDVDCIINNAGILLLGDITNQDPLEWKKMFDVNVLGLLNGMQAVLPKMKANNAGTIINIGSLAGHKTFPKHAGYCGTKFGMHAISENVREEVAEFNIRTIVIAPGTIETEILSQTTDKEILKNYHAWKESIGGAISAESVAESIWFAYNQPQNINIREIVIAPTKQKE